MMTNPPETTVLSEWESKKRLGDVPLVAEHRCRTAEDVEEALDALGGPYVVKGSGIAHKSELGLVRVGLDRQEVGECWERFVAAGDGTVLIAEMVKADLELVVGGQRDPHFGPAVTIGLGGVTAEVLRDAVTVLAPTEPGEVEAAIGLLDGAELLRGYRGMTAVDIDALERVVDAVARLLIEDETVMEVDCNPVMVRDGQPLIVDALVVVESS